MVNRRIKKGTQIAIVVVVSSLVAGLAMFGGMDIAERYADRLNMLPLWLGVLIVAGGYLLSWIINGFTED
jgi:hypothetical protein